MRLALALMLCACATVAPAPSIMAPGGPAEAMGAPPSLIDAPDAGYAAPFMPVMAAQVVMPDGRLQSVAGGYWGSPGRLEAVGQVVDGYNRQVFWGWLIAGVASGMASGFSAYESGRVAGWWH